MRRVVSRTRPRWQRLPQLTDDAKFTIGLLLWVVAIVFGARLAVDRIAEGHHKVLVGREEVSR